MNLALTTLFSALLLLGQACKVKEGVATSPDSENYSNTTVPEKSDKNKDTYPLDEYTQEHKLEGYSQAIFAGGCFWCTEAAFERIEGVQDVISGYSGGHVKNPSYSAVGAGTTGHAEAIAIYYDATVIDYATLLDVFFVAHDPTTLNRQGPDQGEEYRSAIYFQTAEEQKLIDTKIKTLNASEMFGNKIVTEVAAYKQFWVAEGYHQNYYELNPNHGYVAKVSRPKVEKVKKSFPDLIKSKYK